MNNARTRGREIGKVIHVVVLDIPLHLVMILLSGGWGKAGLLCNCECVRYSYKFHLHNPPPSPLLKTGSARTTCPVFIWILGFSLVLTLYRLAHDFQILSVLVRYIRTVLFMLIYWTFFRNSTHKRCVHYSADKLATTLGWPHTQVRDRLSEGQPQESLNAQKFLRKTVMMKDKCF